MIITIRDSKCAKVCRETNPFSPILMTLRRLIVKGNDRAKESGLERCDISLSISPRFYFHRINVVWAEIGRRVPADSVGTAVLAKKWKLHRDDFHVAEATISRAGRVDKNVSVADIEESETARSPLVLCSPLYKIAGCSCHTIRSNAVAQPTFAVRILNPAAYPLTSTTIRKTAAGPKVRRPCDLARY